MPAVQTQKPVFYSGQEVLRAQCLPDFMLMANATGWFSKEENTQSKKTIYTTTSGGVVVQFTEMH